MSFQSFRKPSRPREETVTVTVTFEMPKSTAKFFLQSSVERVINTSMGIVSDSEDDDATINYSDWSEWKPIICDFWSAMHNKIWIELADVVYDLPDTAPNPWPLKKGDPDGC